MGKTKKNIVNVLQTLVQWKIKVIKIDEDIVQVPFYDGCVVWMLVNIAWTSNIWALLVRILLDWIQQQITNN